MASWLAGRPRGLSTAAEGGSRHASSYLTASGRRSRCAASAATPSSSPTPQSGSTSESTGGGDRRERRSARGSPEAILEGWRDAIWARRYIAVRYDCASPSVAHWINRLAGKVGLSDSAFVATVQTTPEEIAALSPAPLADEPAFDGLGAAAASVHGLTRRHRSHASQRRHRRSRCRWHRASRHRRRTSRRPRPQLSANGPTARSSASRTRSPAAGGAADAERLDCVPEGPGESVDRRMFVTSLLVDRTFSGLARSKDGSGRPRGMVRPEGWRVHRQDGGFTKVAGLPILNAAVRL
jgi:hypothetical protein